MQKYLGIRKDSDTQEIVKYDLFLDKKEVQCLYKDINGVFICTKQGKTYKVEATLESLEVEYEQSR